MDTNAKPPAPTPLPVATSDPPAIDLTPTWASVANMLILALEHGTEEGKRMARMELHQMARAADMAAAQQKNGV